MKKRSWVSWCMALLLVLNLLVPVGTVYADAAGPAPADKTSTLTDVSAVVKQNGTEITGDTLPNADNLSIEVSFGVPVAGDYPDGTPDLGTIVQQGDTADISLGKGFSLSAVSGSLPIALVTKTGITVGHITAFNTSGVGAVTARVEFDVQHSADGDNLIDFENDSEVKAGFDANLQVNSDADQDGNGNTFFTILNKTYTIVPPVVQTTYTVVKSGAVDLANKCVNWTVDITAAQGNTDLDLDGYTFSDDLTNVGDYVSGSFKAGSTSGPLTQPTPDPTGPVLSYAFPSGSTSPQRVTFSTALTDAEYYSTTSWTKNNTAQLKSGDTVVKEGLGTVTFTPQWIEKEFKETNDQGGSTGVYSPTNRTITWTITANQNGAMLPDAVITEILKDRLTLDSATLQIKQSGGDWSAPSSISSTPAPATVGDETTCTFSLGTISTPILLTIVTKVPDAGYITGEKTYHNSASINWTDGPGDGIGTGNIGATIGYNAITKSGSLDPKTGIITWTVKVDTREQAINDLKVYDLLAYGRDRAALTDVAGIPDDVSAQYNQKYIDNSFSVTNQSSGSNLTIATTTLQKGGTTVADLLEITGFANDAPNKVEFTFQTQVVNPDIYAGNTTPSVYNTATLFSANAKLNEAKAPVSYPSHMLAKEMLQRGSDPTTAAGANSKTTDASQGFDYVDKSVIFRLSVNAGGMDLTNMPIDALGTKLGSVTVTDTLPEGWVFDTINGSKNFLIFAGSAGNSKSVTATDPALTDTSFMTSDFSGTTSDGKQKTAAFTFSTLDKPYVILVKARPADDTAAAYFSTNQSTTVTNSLNLKSDNWTPGTTTSQDVEINSTILSKTFDSTQAASQAYLTWTVDYKPYDLPGGGTRIEDTLPAGIDLRTDSSGKLVLADNDGNPANIFINELTLQSDGSYLVGASVTPVLGTNVSYDSVSRVLTFNIPDSATAYRFTYVTDITGNSGDITNQVKLYGSSSGEMDTGKSYNIVEQSGWATLNRGGSLTITKTDSTGAPLTGAEFTLYALDGTTVIRKGTVSDDGTLKMRAIPAGSYILRETKIPVGYLSENASAAPADHAVTVTITGSTVTTSIDGKTGTGSNVLTVKNYQSGTVGNLTISKTVAGNAGDQKKAFTFTLNLTGAPGTYTYIGSGVPDGTISSGGAVSLTHGQSITVVGLPKDAAYTVTETNYSADGYSTVSTVTAAKAVGAGSTASGAVVTGTIVADDTQTASFTNTRNVSHSDSTDRTGTLTISKTVTGAGADTTKAFLFTVTFTGASGTYSYTGNGVPDGTIKSGDAISLAHGQSVTITGLPVGASYQVSEDAASAQGYTTDSVGSTGSISADESQTAAFTNTKIFDPGSLTISKTVTGKGASFTRKFKFTVTLTGAPDAYPYTGASSGNLQSGDTVSLSSGESITITGLPAGAGYAVTEADYTGVGYTTSSTGASGTIPTGGAQTAAFTNSWNPLPNKPGEPANPTEDIGDEGVPMGTVDIGDEGVPTGAVDGGGSEETSVMPKTGDSQADSLAKLGLLFFSAALAALSTADFVLRKRYSGKKNRK